MFVDSLMDSDHKVEKKEFSEYVMQWLKNKNDLQRLMGGKFDIIN